MFDILICIVKFIANKKRFIIETIERAIISYIVENNIDLFDDSGD